MANQITELRRAGRYDEAIELGEELISTNNAGEWDYNALFWCYYDIFKNPAIPVTYCLTVEELLLKMSDLYECLPQVEGEDIAATCLAKVRRALSPFNEADELSKKPGQEARAYEILKSLKSQIGEDSSEQAGWIIYRYLRSTPSLNNQEVCEVFKLYLGLKNPRPSMLHSYILRTAISQYRHDGEFPIVEFFIDWNPENFLENDFLPETGANGKKYDSLASYSLKHIYDKFKSNPKHYEGYLPSLIDIFEKVANNNSDDHWQKYRYAKIAYWAGRMEEANRQLMSIASILSPQSYFWFDLANTEVDINRKISLYAKGISLQSDEKFLGLTRLQLAEMLANVGKKDLAKCELAKFAEYREKENQSPGKLYEQLLLKLDNPSASDEDYKLFYQKSIEQAEEVLFQNLPWKKYVVYDIRKMDDGKERFYFINEQGNQLSISRKRFNLIRNSKRGDIVNIRIADRTPDNSPRPVIATPARLERWSILPLKIGYVNYRSDDGVIFVNTPDSAESVRIFDTPATISAGRFISFRIFPKGNRGLVGGDPRIIKDAEGTAKFPSATVVIDNVNFTKNLFHYFNLDGVEGIIKMTPENRSLKVGDCLDISYYKRLDKNENIRLEIIHYEKSSESCPELLKDVEGMLSIIESSFDDSNEYGFVDSCYVPYEWLQGLHNGDYVKGKAFYSKKGKWKVCKLSR